MAEMTAIEIPQMTTQTAVIPIIALINFGGKTVGVGEWRPEKNGLYGTYEVVPGDIKIIKEQ